MASVIVHNGEHFERGKLRYVVFTLVLVALIIASVLFENFFGAIILFLLVGWYILFALMRNKKIVLKNTEQGLVIGEKIMPWTNMQWRNIETNVLTWDRKNLIVVAKSDKFIFTLDDTKENTETFVKELWDFLPMSESIGYSFTEKLIRKLKL